MQGDKLNVSGSEWNVDWGDAAHSDCNGTIVSIEEKPKGVVKVKELDGNVKGFENPIRPFTCGRANSCKTMFDDTCVDPVDLPSLCSHRQRVTRCAEERDKWLAPIKEQVRAAAQQAKAEHGTCHGSGSPCKECKQGMQAKCRECRKCRRKIRKAKRQARRKAWRQARKTWRDPCTTGRACHQSVLHSAYCKCTRCETCVVRLDLTTSRSVCAENHTKSVIASLDRPARWTTQTAMSVHGIVKRGQESFHSERRTRAGIVHTMFMHHAPTLTDTNALQVCPMRQI